MQIIFKKLLLIVGLIAIFAAGFQQHFDDYTNDSFGHGQTTVVQFDKDPNRDAGEELVVIPVLYNQFSKKSFVYYSSSASYQEPSLLAQQRPPNT